MAVEGPPIFMGDPRKKQGVDEIFAFARARKGRESVVVAAPPLRRLAHNVVSPVPPSKFVFRHQQPAKRAAKRGGGGEEMTKQVKRRLGGGGGGKKTSISERTRRGYVDREK